MLNRPIIRVNESAAWTMSYGLGQGNDSFDLLRLREVGRINQDGIAGLHRLCCVVRVALHEPIGLLGDLGVVGRPAARKILSVASGKTTVPISRPSTTTSCDFAARRTCSLTHARTSGIRAIRET
jgi:hypothetical protein